MSECKDDVVADHFQGQEKPGNRRKLTLWGSRVDGGRHVRAVAKHRFDRAAEDMSPAEVHSA